MPFEFAFPEPEKEVIVETGLMQRTIYRTLAVHRGGALVVWSGPSRIGKTKTGEWMVRKAKEIYASSPHRFRIVHYEVGEIDDGRNPMKRAIRSLYHATIGKMPENLYRFLPPEELAALLVQGLRTKNIQMVLIDEAGLLSIEAIRGMVLVRDVAEIQKWTLTLVLIGMDDLPLKVKSNRQVYNRIHEWCYFQPYKVTETCQLLAALNPHFSQLDMSRPDALEQVQFIHDQYGGLPGLIVPFLRKVMGWAADPNFHLDLTLLRAVHLATEYDQERSVADATDEGAGGIGFEPDIRVAGEDIGVDADGDNETEERHRRRKGRGKEPAESSDEGMPPRRGRPPKPLEPPGQSGVEDLDLEDIDSSAEDEMGDDEYDEEAA